MLRPSAHRSTASSTISYLLVRLFNIASSASTLPNPDQIRFRTTPTSHERATATTPHERVSATTTCKITTSQLPVQCAVARLPQERVGTFLMDHLAYKMLHLMLSYKTCNMNPQLSTSVEHATATISLLLSVTTSGSALARPFPSTPKKL